jgi:serine/threonine protein kinase/tetratricopeptide (TPR) repeat protein
MDPPGLKTIFSEAIALPGGPERAAYLHEACHGDAELRAQVDALLRDHERIGRFLGSAAGSIASPGDTAGDVPGDPRAGQTTQSEGFDERAAASVGPGSESSDAVIGPYKLVQSIGEGGMGTVYMAEQTRPVRRTVALKLIKSGMDSRQVLARFEAERQALALMDHPNIARVLDAGTSGTGSPYFVMELVKGIPITRFCDERRLTLRERLELAIPVCQAVQHAHQKGIIHRDLKPSNVLIALYDDKPVPKIIDFGVAKATGPRLTDQTVHTEFGAVVGTLEYMSPEQAQLNQLDVDTRSDIYSLGVLLYELLTGSTPLERKRLQAAAFHEVLRVIREEESPRPSLRLSTTEELPNIAACRHVEPRRLSGLVRGDLDWIVMRALEKDRDRRYETANGLAADLQRYLDHEPVQACPPSTGYRLRKFVRRNQRGLTTAALVGVVLLVAVGAVAGSLVWMARDRATRQHETERGLLEAFAQTETYLGEGEKQMDNPIRWRMTVALAETAARRAEALLATGDATAELADRSRRVRDAVATARQDSAMLVELDRIQFDKAATAAVTKVSETPYAHAGAAPRYATLLRDYGIDPATPAAAADRVRSSRLREVLLAALDDWRRVTPDAAERQQLELVLQNAEPAADAFRQRWLAAVRRGDGAALAQLAGTPAVQDLPIMTVVNLARDLEEAKQVPAAEHLLRDWQERYPGNFWLNNTLGWVLIHQQSSRSQEAARFMTAALALRSDSAAVYVDLAYALEWTKDGEGATRACKAAIRVDPNYATAHNGLGVRLLGWEKDLRGAIREFQEAIRIDPNDPLLHANLGKALLIKGDVEGADREYKVALKIKPNYAEAHNGIANVLWRKYDLEGAVREYKAAIKDNFYNSSAHRNLGEVLLAKNDIEGAINELHTALKIPPEYSEFHLVLARCLLAKNDVDGAIREIQAAFRIDPDFPQARLDLGNALLAKNDVDGAIHEFQAALKIGPTHATDHNAVARELASHPNLKVRDPGRAIKLAQKAVELVPEHAGYWNTLGVAYYRAGDWKEAVAALEKSSELQNGGDSFNGFFLAMSHEKLGDKEKARQWYDRAIQRIDKNQAANEKLRRCREEAAQALGVDRK